MEVKTIIIVILALLIVAVALVLGTPVLMQGRQQAQNFTQVSTELLPT